jgi:hypothetical protein
MDLSALQTWAAEESAALVARFVNVVGAQTETLREQLQAARDRAEAAEAELAQTSAHFAETLDELRQEHATTVREQALSYITLPLDELLTVFNALDRASTLAEGLSALFAGLVREFSRVALFAVRANRFEGVKQSGFDFEHDISKVVVPMAPDSLLGRAVLARRIEGVFSSEASASVGMPFGGSPGCAVALPIALHGKIVAVIYADDSDRPEFASTAPQALVKFAELLLMHGVLVLHRISTEARTEMRDFA